MVAKFTFLLTASCLVALTACTGGTSSGGVCAATTLEAQPSSAAPGAAFVVTGANFSRGCHDTGQGQPQPDEDVRLEFQQGSHTWPLGSVAANSDLVLKKTVEVPAGAVPGPAKVVASGYFGATEDSFEVIDRGTGAVLGVILLAIGFAFRIWYIHFRGRR